MDDGDGMLMSPNSFSTYAGLAFAFIGFFLTLALAVFLGAQAAKPYPASASVSLISLRASRRSRALAFVFSIAMSQNAFVASLMFSAFEWGHATWSVGGFTLLNFAFFEAGSSYAAHAYTPIAYLIWPALGIMAQSTLNKSTKDQVNPV